MENLQTNHVNDATRGEDGHCVLVDCGKTFSSGGAAGLFFAKDEFRALINYVKFVRPLFRPATNQIFSKTNGEWATTSEICKFAQTAWDNFCREEKLPQSHLTFNLLRKTMVTKSREAEVGREAETSMAIQMNHSLSTADRIYDVGNKIHVTKNFRKTLQKIFTTNEPEQDESDEDLELPDEIFDEQKLPVVPVLPLEQKKEVKAKAKRIFETANITLLKSAIGPWILSLIPIKGTVKMQELRARLGETQSGRLLMETLSIDQIYTRVRNTVNGTYKY